MIMTTLKLNSLNTPRTRQSVIYSGEKNCGPKGVVSTRRPSGSHRPCSPGRSAPHTNMTGEGDIIIAQRALSWHPRLPYSGELSLMCGRRHRNAPASSRPCRGVTGALHGR